MSRPEILAPAGNREMLGAAVFSGADAVYLGLTGFNARRTAGTSGFKISMPAARRAISPRRSCRRPFPSATPAGSRSM